MALDQCPASPWHQQSDCGRGAHGFEVGVDLQARGCKRSRPPPHTPTRSRVRGSRGDCGCSGFSPQATETIAFYPHRFLYQPRLGLELWSALVKPLFFASGFGTWSRVSRSPIPSAFRVYHNRFQKTAEPAQGDLRFSKSVGVHTKRARDGTSGYPWPRPKMTSQKRPSNNGRCGFGRARLVHLSPNRPPNMHPAARAVGAGDRFCFSGSSI